MPLNFGKATDLFIPVRRKSGKRSQPVDNDNAPVEKKVEPTSGDLQESPTEANHETSTPVTSTSNAPKSGRTTYTIASASLSHRQEKHRRTPKVTFLGRSVPVASDLPTASPQQVLQPGPEALQPPAEVHYPEELQYYTFCVHTCPPKNRPLNVQPTFRLLSGHPAAVSTLEGRCPSCDDAHRRALEAHVLAECAEQIRKCNMRLDDLRKTLGGVLDRDSFAARAIAREVDGLVKDREEDVRQIWKGYSARWGPGTIGFEQKREGVEGRMKVAWIRPDKKAEGTSKGRGREV